MELRPYQEQAIADLKTEFGKGVNSTLLWLPTGGGKTTLTSAMFKRTTAKGNTAFFICHRRELIAQVARAMDVFGLKYGYIAAGFPTNFKAPIQICSLQTLASRLSTIPIKPRLCVWDETHHIAAASWKRVFVHYAGAKHIGLTATPERLDGKGLDDYYQSIVRGPTVQQLTDMGYLCPARVFAPSQDKVKLDGVEMRGGDYAIEELSKVMDKPSITGDAVQHYLKHGAGKRAVVFCVKIEHSMNVVQEFIGAGITAEHVDGTYDAHSRDSAIKRFERGETKVLCNVDLFGEGFDLPAIEVAILLRPTKSVSLYLQQVGRALRPVYKPGFPLGTDEERRAAISQSDKPYAIVLDHAGNALVHGLPHQDREWKLEGRPKKKGKGEKKKAPPIRQCPECFMANPVHAESCLSCGHVFEKGGREVEQVEGELKELTATMSDPLAFAYAKQDMQRILSSKKDYKATYNELRMFAEQQGYKKPHAWAWLQMKLREKGGRSHG